MLRNLLSLRQFMTWNATCLALCAAGSTTQAASTVPPTVAQALSLKPIQAGIDYDTPDAEAQKSCKVVSAKELNQRGWLLQDGDGRLLRRFIDTNADNRLDQWCYYKNGIEIYRDIDSDHDEKADQYRWLGTAGTRWGLDPNEDGTIDSWKVISAEEVSAEIVAAVRTKDWQRFSCVLLSQDELDEVGVTGEKRDEMAKQITQAKKAFEDFVKTQEIVTPTSRWAYFGNTIPFMVPAGTDGSSKDIILYDNAITDVEDQDDHRQLAIGTLIQVEKGWRVLTAPEALVSGQAMQQRNLFMQASMAREVEDGQPQAPQGVSGKLQDLLIKLGEVETRLNAATSTKARATAISDYVDVLIELANESSTDQDKNNWLRQAVDTLYIDFQQTGSPQGIKTLEELAEALDKAKAPIDSRAYAEYRVIEANYLASSNSEDANPAEQQKEWVESLEDFIEKYEASDISSDALRELALVEEFAQNNKKAIEWYEMIVDKYPNSPNAAKAQGAAWRLSAEGKPISLKATTIEGKSFDIASMRGKPIVIHTWATWCDVCTQEFDGLKQLRAKHARDGLQVVGINVDMNQEDVVDYLSKNRLAWPQLFAEGGQDSDLANQLGIVSLPVTLLIDDKGKVVKQVFSVAELSDELEKLLK